MSYYQQAQQAAIFVDKLVKNIISGQEMTVSSIILQTTATYAVSERFVLKRLDLWRQNLPTLQIIEGMLYYEPETSQNAPETPAEQPQQG
jgi:hypothetical protein